MFGSNIRYSVCVCLVRVFDIECVCLVQIFDIEASSIKHYSIKCTCVLFFYRKLKVMTGHNSDHWFRT